MQPTPVSTPAAAPPSEFVRSALFWLTMFAALGLYGVVVLSPKLAHREKLRAEHRQLQVSLLADERQLLRFEQIADALVKDKQFKAELVRLQMKKRAAGEEVIPLETNLVLPNELQHPQVRETAALPRASWYAPLVSAIAASTDIRGVILLSSVVLILFAFGFLHLSSEKKPARVKTKEEEKKPPKKTFFSEWMKRYEKADKPQDKAHPNLPLGLLGSLEEPPKWEEDPLRIEDTETV